MVTDPAFWSRVGRLGLEPDVTLSDLAGVVAALATAPYDAPGCRSALARILRGST